MNKNESIFFIIYKYSMKYLQRLSNELKQYELSAKPYHITEPSDFITSIKKLPTEYEKWLAYEKYIETLAIAFTKNRNLKLMISILLKFTEYEKGVFIIYRYIIEKLMKAGNIKYITLFRRLGFLYSECLVGKAIMGYPNCLKLFHKWGMDVRYFIHLAALGYPKCMELLHSWGEDGNFAALIHAFDSNNPKCLRLLYEWKTPFSFDELWYVRHMRGNTTAQIENIVLLDKWIMERQNEKK